MASVDKERPVEESVVPAFFHHELTESVIAMMKIPEEMWQATSKIVQEATVVYKMANEPTAQTIQEIFSAR